RICQFTNWLAQAWTHEIPDCSTHDAWILVNDIPIFIKSTTGIPGHRKVFVHKRWSRINTFRNHSHLCFEIKRSSITWTNNLFTRVRKSIPSIHPVSCTVIFPSFINYSTYIFPFPSLVACTPEKNGRMIAVAQYHFANPLSIHGLQLSPIGQIVSSMSFNSCFVNNIESIFV